MGFDELPTIETPDKYLDFAFLKARKESREYNLKDYEKSRGKQVLAIIKVKAVRDDLTKRLSVIIDKYPNFDNLNEFYTQLIRATLDFPSLKKSLGSVNWVVSQVKELSRKTLSQLKGSKEPMQVVSAYYGRISSLLKQIKPELHYLHEARQTLRAFPSVKEGLFTICIGGFPNVGKSTLLSQITPAKPEINKYAFTTKRLNLGYAKQDGLKLQFIDTPGTLNRVEKMNDIELQAYLAMRYVADCIVYVFDLTEEAATLMDQKKLYKRLKDTGKLVVVYLSKTDILDKQFYENFSVDADSFIDRKVLLDKLFVLAKTHY